MLSILVFLLCVADRMDLSSADSSMPPAGKRGADLIAGAAASSQATAKRQNSQEPGVASVAPSEAQQNESKKSTATKPSKSQAAILKVMGQLTLTNARSIATVNSLLMDVIIFPIAKLDMVAPVKEVTRAYSKLDKQTRTEKGPPHIHVWNKVIPVLTEFAEETKETEMKLELTQFTTLFKDAVMKSVDNPKTATKEKIDAASIALLCSSVKHMRVTLCWDKVNCKLEVMVKPGSSCQVIVPTMMSLLVKHADGVTKTTAAPRGKLEREIADFVGWKETKE